MKHLTEALGPMIAHFELRTNETGQNSGFSRANTAFGDEDDDFKIKDAATRSQINGKDKLSTWQDACTICLEPISERAVAVPCNVRLEPSHFRAEDELLAFADALDGGGDLATEGTVLPLQIEQGHSHGSAAFW